jgi:type VI secretion system protein VasG
LREDNAAVASSEEEQEQEAEAVTEEQLTIEALTEYLKDEAAKQFTMPLVARMTVLPFLPLDEDALKDIAELKLAKVKKQLKEQRKLDLTWEKDVPSWIVGRCDTAGFGARLIDQIVQTELMPGVTRELLAVLADGRTPGSIHVSPGDGEDAPLKVEVS